MQTEFSLSSQVSGTRRRIVLWPWDVPPSTGAGLVVGAVANPAIEAVLVKEGTNLVPKSPQEACAPGTVAGFQLILRVIEAPTPDQRRKGFAASPRVDLATQRVVVEQFDEQTHDTSDPRLVVPRKGVGIRLPSVSHLRRVVLGPDGTLLRVGEVVLPETTRFEVLGKEDPSVTWLDGVPYLSYVGVSDFGITPVLARGRTVDGQLVYERVAEAQGHHDNRDVKILPVRARGRMWRHDRPNTLPWGPKRVYCAWSNDDGLSWSASLPLFEGEADWERNHIGAGAVPFVHRTADGDDLLVSFYHGVHKRSDAVAGVYQTGMACFDPADPTRLVGRMSEPVLPVWSGEGFHAARRAACPLEETAFRDRHGLFVVEPVVFTTGHARVGDQQLLFSGVNDFAIEVAELPGMEVLLGSPAYRRIRRQDPEGSPR